MITKIIASVLLIIGAFVVYGSNIIINYFSLDKKMKLPKDYELEEDAIESYKTQKATVYVKVFGLLLVIPGIILILIEFR